LREQFYSLNNCYCNREISTFEQTVPVSFTVTQFRRQIVVCDRMSSHKYTTEAMREPRTSANRQTSLKRKSSMKSIDDSRSMQRIENNISGDDGDCDQSTRYRSVRFSSVDIRDYSICLGDNPSVSRGVPISLDWEYEPEHSHEINSYEHDRLDDRKDPDDLKLPSLQRVQLLKNLGYSRGEIKEQTTEIIMVKQKRLSTRRRIERKERIKDLARAIVKAFENIVYIFNPMKCRSYSFVKNTKQVDAPCLLEPDDDTLTSSISSKKSEMSVAENS